MANILPSQAGYKGKSPEEQEVFEYYSKLRRGDGSLRVLEESEAAEGLPMVPEAALNEILSMRYEYSLIDKLGIRRLKTDRLHLNIASEAAGHSIQPVIAEEAAHIAEEPAFLLTDIAVSKWGSMVTATEEMLEDQALFQSWLPGAIARQMGLQENAQLYATLAAAGTLGDKLNASHTLTEAELWALYEAMPDPWHDGARVVMNRVTARVMRQFLVASPKMWAMAPELNIAASGGSHWMDMPLFTNTNWPSILTAANNDEIITLVNPDAVAFVERHGVEIYVDPYGAAATGSTRFFPTARWCMAVVHPLGVVHMTDVV